MKKGEIWLVNFDPSAGHEIQKIRPALIIQSSKINSSLVTILPLSSQVQKKNKDDIFLQKNSKNRLFSDSIIKIHHISSFDQCRFMHIIGSVPTQTIREIEACLRKHFDL